jgi:acetyl/propionyl-CoA carboxylase alpha subunit
MVSRRTKFVARPLVAQNGEPRIRRLLIANRGEIACRIISTCKELGIVSIAIYTDEDRDSLHIQAADEAVCLSSIQQEDGNPHQNSKLIVNTALSHQADAIHPGYGYLSENAEFARKARQAGLTFVGPSPHAISVLGDKRQAKDFLLREAPQVPVVPGYTGTAQDAHTLEREAEKIGFPVMIKAAAGGGGKGMRIARNKTSLRDELSGAQSEAQRSFGSSDCLLEKYVERSKHIEIQILGDSSGNVISLGDRECSIQRRHQKIIEEAPSPWMSENTRAKMAEAAVTIGKLLRYEGAGTVEFIVDVDTAQFYFLEVNTRIQVEHAITEEVMGVDIVALQLYIASGGLLADLSGLSSRTSSGHSIECRLCAEDPMQSFMPDSGRILRWTPGTELLNIQQIERVRIETAIQTGSSVLVYFDSMIAKIIVWAPDRKRAIAKMLNVLRHTIIVGIKTNHLFLQACLLHDEFGKVDYTTNFIPDHIDKLLSNPYMKDTRKWQEGTSFLPGLFSRWIANSIRQQSSSRPFPSIRTRFRNQPFDTSNRLHDVVIMRDSSSPKDTQQRSFLLTWSAGRNTPKETFHYRTQLLPQWAVAIEKDDSDNPPDPGTQLAQHFNETFTQLLQQRDSPAEYHTVRILDVSIEQHKPEDSSFSWLSSRITVSHNKVHQTYHITTSPTFLTKRSPGLPEQIFISTPELGTSIACERHTMLSWGESQRALFSMGEQIDQLRVYISAMPCKVLRVLKSKSEQVKAGEAMLVVESMKTEVKIVAAVDGIFEPEVKEGDAVGDGVVLCKLV